MSFEKPVRVSAKEAHTFRVAPEVTSAFVLNFFQALDCPRALSAYLLYKHGEHKQLSELECNPLHYRNTMEFRDAYAATCFLSKFRDLNTGVDLKTTALNKFEKFELQCMQTNTRFADLSKDPLFIGPVVWLHNAVVRKIDTILGEFDTEEMFRQANWGPGATTRMSSRDASPANKFQQEVGITRDLYDLLPSAAWSDAYPTWAAHMLDQGFPQFELGNKIITVEKNAMTDRVIAVEPGLNLWFQLAVGDMMRSRLRLFGIDLRFQNENQRLAKLGSKTGQLATIDLSSASDSIATSVVESLLPRRWFTVCDGLRSRYGLLDKRLVRWEKFSSMGNGFTFPLQSLIFFAIAKCVEEYKQTRPSRDKSVSVYGDDIIIPVDCLDLFSDMLKFYGFTMNTRKSHFASTFRESCGSHYMSGVDVKPIYLKDSLSSLSSVFRVANAVRRMAHRRNANYGCDAVFRTTYGRLVSLVPKPLRLRIPDDLGDGGFVSNFDEATPRRARHGVEGFFVTHVVTIAKTYESEGVGLLLARLWGRPTQEAEYTLPLTNRALRQSALRFRDVQTPLEGGNKIPRKMSTELRITNKTLVQQWVDLGPWL